jgi:uncharacterized membrane protein YcjF (UPF0283 family)
MDWVFEGIGTLVIGIILGATGGSVVTRQVMLNRLSQRQKAGDGARQVQAGRDARTDENS